MKYAVCCFYDLPLHTMNLTLSNSLSYRNLFNGCLENKYPPILYIYIYIYFLFTGGGAEAILVQ